MSNDRNRLILLEDKWDGNDIKGYDDGEILRYRSNLLGSDLRITNFGGGNTSSKVIEQDKITGADVDVLWVKGSGGDLGSIKRDGFARLDMSKFLALQEKYRGMEFEDEMLEYYPLCQFGLNNRPASIDTPLHGLVPYKHIDHMHPDWAIALAASGNGQQKLREFNDQFQYNLIWLPWQRPGYHLGCMLENAVKENPGAEGVILASHGLITWADDQYECYRLTIEVIDAMGQFINTFQNTKGDKLFSGQKFTSRNDRDHCADFIFPYLRGVVKTDRPVIGNFDDSADVLRFVNSADGEKLAFQGTSCPDHFIRTKVRPLYVKWDTKNGTIADLKSAVDASLKTYQLEYEKYYESNKEEDSPPIRGVNPTVVLIPGIGMFSFGKSKKEARITGEFYINAIHVMEGSTSLDNGKLDSEIDKKFVLNNYVALTPREAFRIEYWALEEAKIRRQPAEKEMARKVAVVLGGGSGIGKEFCKKLAGEGAHVVIADFNYRAAQEAEHELSEQMGNEVFMSVDVDISDRASVKKAFKKAILDFGGLDILVNTAALFTQPDKENTFSDESWNKTLTINISSNYIVTEVFAEIVNEQGTDGAVVLTSSANAVVPKSGSEPYDVSKAAVNHLIRELAIRYAPNIRINGVSPATVIEGSSMFSRERIMKSLEKYKIPFDKNEEMSELAIKLSEFYAQRTLTHRPIVPINVVEAGYYLLSPRSDRTTGHIIPVDGGLTEAFLR